MKIPVKQWRLAGIFLQTTERNRHKRPNKIATNDRTKSPQTTEQNRHKQPNKIATNNRKVVGMYP